MPPAEPESPPASGFDPGAWAKKLSPYEWFGPAALCLLFYLVSSTEPMQRLENLTLDKRIQVRAKRQELPDQRLFLVGIDDESIRNLGRWPFPRHIHGAFMNYLGLEQPAVAAWDVIFDSPSLLEEDTAFIEGVKASRIPVVTGAVGGGIHPGEPDTFGSGWKMPVTLNLRALPDCPGLTLPMESLRPISRFGMADAEPGNDGVIRKVRLIFRHGNHLLPSLPLAALIDYWKLGSSEIRILPGDAVYLDSESIQRRIPIDAEGYYHINYRYEHEDFKNANHGYSKLLYNLQRRHKLLETVPIPNLQGKILFIGQVSTALTDVGPSPRLGKSLRPLTHLNVLDNILKEDYLKAWPKGVFWLCLFIAVWASLLVLHGRSLTLCLLVPLFLVLGYVTASFFAFERANLQLELVAPCLALVSVHFGNIAQLVLRERQKRQELRRTFSAYFSAGAIDAIYHNEATLQLGGAQKEVAVLFSDIRGFTSMTESMDSQQLVAQLNEYFTHLVDAINRHQGSLHKFIGDAIMAVWGDISYSGPAVDAGQALRAGLLMSRESHRLNKLWQAEGKPAFLTGIGINHGKVILGNIGAPQRREFTVIGDAVNLASRLEGLTKRFGCPIIVGESVYELTFERFVFRPLGKIRATGKVHPVQIYQPLHELGHEDESPFTASWLKLYLEAFNRFSERRYDLAIRLFEACLQEYPNDAASRLILETAQELQANPPPASWDGAFEFEGK